MEQSVKWRDKHMVTFIESTERKCEKIAQKAFWALKKMEGGGGGVVWEATSNYEGKVDYIRQKGRFIRVVVASENEFEIMDKEYKVFVVNLQNKTYGFNAYQICGIPHKPAMPTKLGIFIH